MSEPALFTPFAAGDLKLANRIVMAPLTRNRAGRNGDVPNPLNVEYYRQRATAGLIITEGSQISPVAKGYAWTPGIYSDAQVEGWRQVTDAVHAEGGKIVIQLWHVGRVSHTAHQPAGGAPVAPSAIRAATRTFDGDEFVETSEPRALELSEIAETIEDYRKAAENAKRAGFDGVELHGANGYLVEQFLRECSNTRTDAYGGSIENRTRFLFDVLEVLTGVLGGGRVGVRLSPFSPANGMDIAGAMETYTAAVRGLNRFGLAYLHLVEGATGGSRELAEGNDLAALRALFDGPYMANNGYDRNMAIDAVESGAADLVAFGRPFISNPDLVARLKADAPLSQGDRATYYGGGAEGYTDYPTLAESAAA